MFLREPSHVLILLIIVILLFGAKRLPDSAKSLGRSLKIFRNEMKSDETDSKESNKEQNTGETDPR